MPAPYSAGSIFLQVVPSFRGVPEQIAKEARGHGEAYGKGFDEGFAKELEKGLPDAVEKASGKAKAASRKAGADQGKEYVGQFESAVRRATASLGKQLSTIKVDVDDAGATAAIRRIKLNLSDLTDTRIGVDIDADEAFTKLTEIETELRAIQDTATDIDVRVNAAGALKGIAAIRGELMALNNIQIEPELKVDRQLGKFEAQIKSAVKGALDSIPPVDLELDSSEAAQKIAQIRTELFALSDARIGIDVSADEAFLRVGSLQTELAELSRTGRIDIDVNAAAAEASLATVLASVEALHARDHVEIEVDVDALEAVAELEAVERAARRAGDSGLDGANSFRAFNGRLLGLAAVGPLAIPVLGALAGGVGGLIPLLLAGGIGAGVMALGLAGIGDAVKAAGAAQRTGAADAAEYARGVRTASNGVRDAEQALARARDDAGQSAERSNQRVMDALDGVEDATRGVTRAQRDLTDAQEGEADAVREVLRAQEALTRAREEAAEGVEDLAFAIRGGSLDERDAIRDLEDAQAAYNASVDDPAATARDRAVLLDSLERQQLRLEQIRDSNDDLAKEQAEVNRTGIEGTNGVVSAQERLQAAQDGVVAAQQRVADANDRIAEANDRVADAQAEVARARAEQSRAAIDSSQAVSDAQERLTEAQIAYTEAVAETSASQEKLAQTMGALGPAGQSFVAFLLGLRPFLGELRLAAQEGFLPGLQEGIDSVITGRGAQFISIVSGMAGALGGMFAAFGQSLAGPAFGAFFDMVERSGPVFIGQMAQILVNLGEGVASLLTALEPLGLLFGDALISGTQQFSDWAAGLSQSTGFKEFIDYVQRIGPMVVAFFVALGGAVGNLAVALAPYAEDLLRFFTGALNFVAEMDPDTLAAVVIALVGITLAFQGIVGLASLVTGFTTVINLASTAMAFLGITSPVAAAGTTAAGTAAAGASGGFTALAGSLGAIVVGIGIAIAAIGLIGLALYLLWQNSETFRNIVTAVFDAVVGAATFMADWFMTNIWPRMQWVWEAIMDVVTTVWETVLKPIFALWTTVFGVLMGWLELAWREIGQPVFELIWSIVQATWSIISPLLELMWLAFQFLWSFVAAVWEDIGAPVFGFIVDVVSKLWTNVFDPVMRFLIEAFGNVVAFFASAWETVGKPVFDLIASVVTALVGVFQGSYDGIKGIWDALFAVLLSPIRFVVETVLNNGLIAGINHIAGIFTDDDTWIDPIPTGWIDTAQNAGSFNRAYGGMIPGSSPHKRADNVLINATAGEFMQQVDAVDYYGVDIMEALNQRRIPREMLQSRATGGLIDAMWGPVKARFPGARKTSDYRPGDPGYHGTKRAIDIGGSFPYPNATGIRELLAINQWLASTYGSNIAQLIHTQPGAINLLRGKPHNYGAATAAEHRNHVHLAFDSIAQIVRGAAAGGGDAGGGFFGALGDFFEGAADFLASPVEFLKNIVKEKAGDKLGTRIGELLIEIPFKVAENVADSLLDLVSMGGDDPMVASKPVDVPGGSVMDIVRATAQQYGWDTGGNWDAINWIIGKESGGNPNAQNPTSTASGLFQHINGTWNAYKPPGVTAGRMRDASVPQQAAAGMAYLKDRYGTPGAARAFWARNGYYADGGLIEAADGPAPVVPALHDMGGWLTPGLNVVMNRTSKPEAVLNPQQWSNVERIVENGTVGGGFSFGENAQFIGYDPEDLMQAWRHEQQNAAVAADLAGATVNI